MNLFVTSGVAGMPMISVVRAALPLFAVLILVTYVPWISPFKRGQLFKVVAFASYASRAASIVARWSNAQYPNALTGSRNDCPISVRLYSTFGGLGQCMEGGAKRDLV